MRKIHKLYFKNCLPKRRLKRLRCTGKKDIPIKLKKEFRAYTNKRKKETNNFSLFFELKESNPEEEFEESFPNYEKYKNDNDSFQDLNPSIAANICINDPYIIKERIS